MRKLSIFTLLLIGVFCMGLMVVSADDDDEAKTEAKVRLGYRGVDSNGSLGGIAEYRSLEESLGAAFKLKHLSKTTKVKAWGVFNDRDDITAKFYADMDRMFQVEASYVEFLHRLDHDPLTNLNAVKTPKVTRSTDFDPGRDYSIVRAEFDVRAKFKHPDIPGIMIEATYNQIQRQGHKQARTLSKCANCHVVGYGREVDQLTQSYSVGATYSGDQFSLGAELSGRSFEEQGATPTHTYMDILHPVNYVPVFNDRAIFSELDGPLPFNQVPKNTKWKAKLNGNVVNESVGSLNAGYVYSEVENDDMGISMSFTGFHGSWFRKFNKELSLSVKGRYYTIDNDDYFYDSVEPVAVSGPYAGKTYREQWGANPDLDRKSAYNRDVFNIDADLRYRFAKRSVLTLGYRYKMIDREYYAVTEAGDTETTHNRFKATVNTSLMKGNRINAEFVYEAIDQPYINLYAAGSPKQDPTPVPSPLAGGSIQYFQLYGTREVNLAANPNQIMSLRATIKQKLDKGVSLMGTFTWKDSSNDELNISEWNETHMGINASLWFAISPEFSGMVSYNYKDSEKDTLFVLPIFDG
jgi:hypothetical protein